MDYLKLAISVLSGIVAAFFGSYGFIIGLVAVAIVFDFTTGLVRGKIKGDINSKKGFTGFWKKIALLLGLFFGIFLDYFIPVLLESGVNIVLPFSLPFGLIVGAYIILNEGISIIENLYECGVKMPPFILKLLKAAGEQLDGDKNERTN